MPSIYTNMDENHNGFTLPGLVIIVRHVDVALLVVVVCYILSDLSFIFLLTNKFKQMYMCLITLHVLSLGKCLCKYFAYI